MADFKWVSTADEFSVQRVNDDGEPHGEKLDFAFDDWSDSNVDKMAQFGRKAFFQARASQVDTADKFEYWKALDELMRSDEFEFERKAGPRAVATWIEALAADQGVSVGAIQKALVAYSKEQRAEIEKSVRERLADEIKALEERAAIDLGSFLK